MKMPDLAVILPAAGASSRFGADKLRQPLDGSTVIERTILAFARRTEVAMILIATRSTDLVRPDGKTHLCAGGATRAHSVLSALKQVPESIDWIAIHDAARPLVSQALIARTLDAAREHGAAAPAMPMHLTVKQATGPLPARVRRTIPRHDLWTMQTPQIMRRADLLAAFARCPIPLDQVTDDAQLLELADYPVHLVPGEERNLKITTPLDLRLAEWLLDTTSPTSPRPHAVE